MVNDARARAETLLDSKVDELCTFEREYRTRVRTYLEAQMQWEPAV